MADTIRETILADIKTALEAITIANGYVNTIDNVQRWEQAGNSIKDVPCVMVEAGIEEKEHRSGFITSCKFAIRVELWARHDTSVYTGSTDAYLNTFAGDVEKALMVDYTRGGVAVATRVLNSVPFETATGQPSVGLIFDVEVEYRHNSLDPTVQ